MRFLKHLISFILPITVLIIVPLVIESKIVIKSLPALIPGLVCILIGLSVICATIALFIKNGNGTLAPWNPTTKLVIKGPYRYVRNPMILGVLIVLLGESLTVLSIRILIWALIFFLTNHVYFILYEEPDLEKKFGEEYKEYKGLVPRWIPRKNPSNKR